MDIWREIRLQARQRRSEIENGTRIARASDLVAKARKEVGLQLDRFAPGTVYSDGVVGALEREDGFVRVLEGLETSREAIVIAHELAHFWLHDESQFLIRSTEPSFGGQPFEVGVERVIAYSPRERREVQADVFAQEFLVPTDWLRQQMIAARLRPSTIAEDLGLPLEFVMMQALRALLLPPLRPPVATKPGGAAPPLDKEQGEAARWEAGPLMVDAGPGTGKTKTLVARIEHLLAKGVAPSSILALTFSNKAAAEMTERIERLHPAAAPLIWIGTFHAFGLELLRIHGKEIGIEEDFEVADESDALALLENILVELPLHHYQNLWDPALELRPVLRAISRAKDEMITPEEYQAAAIATERAARTEEQIERAEKAREVAEVYAIYQRALREGGLVDFGDLVEQAARLVRDKDSVRGALRTRFKHVLIDEYQDVNYASTQLLKALRGDGEGLWVVADPRQSIYRFRGAAPATVLGFTSDYKGAQRKPLRTNYRSGGPVLGVFERFGAGIAAAPKPPASWHAHRGQVGAVHYLQAPDLASEAAGVGQQIAGLKQSGVPYREQAVLARTHLTLARLAKHLEADGIPILYLGDLFERREIRDLLSLVSIGAEYGGAGLVRFAQLPEYGATRADALAVLEEAERSGESVVAVCGRAGVLAGVSARSAEGLVRLAEHLKNVEPHTSAWRLLTLYLFERSHYLVPLIEADDVPSQQALVAIYQLLKFCREHHDRHAGMGERRKLLESIRRLERLDDDRAFRVVPPEAEDIDAVRFMTIHASKGLEFEAVHLPVVASRYLPDSRRPSRCPAPLGLERLEISPQEHDAEEECLFFVALSRARDVLSISHAERYTPKQKSGPSKYLKNLGGVLPSPRQLNARAIPAAEPPLEAPAPREEYEERQLQLYADCPARYRYETVDGLRGPRDASAYLKFHGCVRQVIAWMESERQAGTAISPEAAVERLRLEWSERGPVGHGYEAIYRRAAEDMVRRAAAVIASDQGVPVEAVWRLTIAGRPVIAMPDRVAQLPDGTVVAQRIRTGRKTKSEAGKAIWAFLQAAGRAAFPGRTVRLQAFYPATGEQVHIAPEDPEESFAMYEDAIAGIERGLFTPTPSRDCPACQFYFICTSETAR
jgi:DNA helicase II / ATP-dependent DNA helicase PcrA